VGYKLPDVHVFNKEPLTLKSFFKKWFLHPLKRRVAKFYLLLLRNIFGVRVIGITGSAGKTTTKEMLVSILKESGRVTASYKNIDPIYNIPDTILKCSLSTKYLILEMGVEYPGEMDFYLWLAKPDISVITNINPTHLEYFNTVDNVYLEKIKIASSLNENGLVILNGEDDRLKSSKKTIKAHIIYFGKGSDIYASDISINSMGSIYTLNLNKDKIIVHLPVIGSHFIYNSLAAASVAHYLNIPEEIINKGLKNFSVPEHRMNIFNEKRGTLIIDDTYNSNPKAMEEALKVFEKLSEEHKNYRKGIVFGDMLELGDLSDHYHREIGKYISRLNIDFLICVGSKTAPLIEEVKKTGRKNDVFVVESADDAFKIFRKYLGKESMVLLKGSRSIGLDKVVEKLLA
jgi:UDP-N-acetylmuramoyl-tripeptide--D-alanyl-D-alanine ligase